MKKLGILIVFIMTTWNVLVAQSNSQFFRQYDNDYHVKFNEIRAHLGKGRLSEAYVLLKDLIKVDSTNHYTHYLLGVCHTEQNIVTKESIKHLEFAVKSILTEYKYIPYTETRAPIFAWYYLCKAYSQNGMCAKARWAKENFLQYHNDYTENLYFNTNIKKFMIHCNEVEDQLRNQARKESIVTKEIEYTTQAPLYGIQVGAFNELVPVREEFDDLKNVEAFMDTTGVLRYVVGHFGTRSQAQSLLNIVKQNGYPDAFIVNVNEVNKFSNEVIIVDNMSFKTHIMGDITYKVQIGAFRDSIPQEIAQLYLQVDEIEEVKENDLTLMQVGGYEEYTLAQRKKDELVKLGIPGPFVVAYDNRQKLSVKAAQKYQERQRQEAAEKVKEEDNKKTKKKKTKDDERL